MPTTVLLANTTLEASWQRLYLNNFLTRNCRISSFLPSSSLHVDFPLGEQVRTSTLTPKFEALSARKPISDECHGDLVQSNDREAWLNGNASLEDFYCPGTGESPSGSARYLGFFDSSDHWRLGVSSPGTKEDYLEDGDVRCHDFFSAEPEPGPVWNENFEALKVYPTMPLEFDIANLGTDQVDNVSLNLYRPGLRDTVTEEDKLAYAHLETGEMGGNPMELEISEETLYTPTNLALSSTISSLNPTTTYYTSSSTDHSPAAQSIESQSSNETPPNPISNNTYSGQKWICSIDGCLKTFRCCRDRNAHQRYHAKPWPCLEPSCLKSFSLKKDLVRHYKDIHKPKGEPFRCPIATCKHAVGGTGRGFARKDNLQKHMKKKQH
ncbi:hypothetical protein B7463_g9050, partial [Scytalidium lignicola]